MLSRKAEVTFQAGGVLVASMECAWTCMCAQARVCGWCAAGRGYASLGA